MTSPTKVIASTLQLQPKKSSSPLSKIKFHSITKKKMSSGGNSKRMLNEKFHLINKKHATSSSSSADFNDYFNYNTINDGHHSGTKSASSLKRYLLFKFGDKSVDSNTLEAKNLFHLNKRHNHNHRHQTSDNDFDVLDF